MAQWVGFCRSEGLTAAYDDAAVHEAGHGHLWTFGKRENWHLNVCFPVPFQPVDTVLADLNLDPEYRLSR